MKKQVRSTGPHSSEKRGVGKQDQTVVSICTVRPRCMILSSGPLDGKFPTSELKPRGRREDTCLTAWRAGLCSVIHSSNEHMVRPPQQPPPSPPQQTTSIARNASHSTLRPQNMLTSRHITRDRQQTQVQAANPGICM